MIRVRRAPEGERVKALSELSSSSGVPRSMRSDHELRCATITSLPVAIPIRVISEVLGSVVARDVLIAEPLRLSGRALLPLSVFETALRGGRTGPL